jgi:hypothetical protein
VDVGRRNHQHDRHFCRVVLAARIFHAIAFRFKNLNAAGGADYLLPAVVSLTSTGIELSALVEFRRCY